MRHRRPTSTHFARAAYDLLLSYADRPCVGGFAVLCPGSAVYPLGVAASTFGDHDGAVDHLGRSDTDNRRLVYLPMLAITEADLARALLRRGRPADNQAAVGLPAGAVAAADDMAMHRRATACCDRLATLASTPPGAIEDQTVPRQGTIRRHGARWEIALGRQRVRLGGLIGMTYLAELLTRPGHLIPSLTLAGQGSVPDLSSRQELLDAEARAAYQARARELAAELTEAEAHHDLGRAEKLRVEIDMLVTELEAATGLRDRPRAFTDARERARSALRKAIKRAIDAIDDANPAIAEPIRNTVTTGVNCLYTPDPRTPIVWSAKETSDLAPHL
jgi:hypothetical protein